MSRALLVLCSLAVLVGAAPTAAAAEPPPYREPVDAEVEDPFRPPTTPYGPGNRGIEYATAPGTEVRSAADGTVTFAGLVAGTRHVTVRHGDGVRTTYSYLDAVHVVVGQVVRQGTVVGTTTGHLHLGARRGDAYFDPASLFAPGPVRVRLVPFDEPPGPGADGERSAVRQLIGGIGGLLDRGTDAAGRAASWLRDDGSQLLRTTLHQATRLSPPVLALTGWRAVERARHAASRPCTSGDAAVVAPPGRRAAVLVAGLGSNSRGSTIDDVDTRALGYAAPDVLRFSYAGGRVPDATDGFGHLPTSDYDAPHTQEDLVLVGRRLADLVEQVVAAAPGVPVDLFAHSQGGLVVRVALVELERRHGVEWLRALGLVATLGSPHGGADLATAIHGVASTPLGSAGLDAVAGATDQELDDDGASVAQLSETSTLVATLADHPVPPTVRAVSIAARGDLIVPVPRTVAPGMEEVVVPLVGASAHTRLPGSPEAARELALALAGRPPGCRSMAEALLDQAVGEGISAAEDLVGSAGLAVALR